MLASLVTLFCGSGEKRANLLLKISRTLAKKKSNVLAKLVLHYLHREYGCYIHQSAEIGSGFLMMHPDGIVIGAGAVIGKQVTVYQQVTIGAAREGDYEKRNYPTIGDGTVLYAGSKIIGRIKIGRNCIVGANAVVTRDVPDNSVAIGIPARNFERNDSNI